MAFIVSLCDTFSFDLTPLVNHPAGFDRFSLVAWPHSPIKELL